VYQVFWRIAPTIRLVGSVTSFEMAFLAPLATYGAIINSTSAARAKVKTSSLKLLANLDLACL